MISIETNRESYFNELAEVVRVFYGMTDVQSAGSPQAQQAEVFAPLRCFAPKAGLWPECRIQGAALWARTQSSKTTLPRSPRERMRASAPCW